MTPFDVDASGGLDLNALSEMELVDLYTRVRALLAERLTRQDGSESLEMLFARIAEVAEPPRVPTVHITPREREVLHFLAKDASNADIAAALFVSIFTIKRHVASILTKYGVRTRNGAVMAAIKDGLLIVD